MVDNFIPVEEKCGFELRSIAADYNTLRVRIEIHPTECSRSLMSASFPATPRETHVLCRISWCYCTSQAG
jgi:hypothetical protein